MGASSSLTGFQQCLNQLSQNDYSEDENFWKGIFQQETDLNDTLLWYPGILNKIAARQPANMIKLISVCVYNIDCISLSESKKLPISSQLNILCQIFTSSCSVILSNQQFSPLFPNIKPYIPNYLSSAAKCITIQSLTGIISTSKSTNKSIKYIRARYDLIHSVLCTLNFNYFTKFIDDPPLLELSIPDFPTPLFIRMICELSDKNEMENTLFKNCIALLTKLGSQISNSLSSVDPMILYKYFINNNAFDQYSIIFFFQCSLYNKNFIEQITENTKLFLFKILNFSMKKLEESGISFIHTVTANTIQLILENKNSLSQVNDQFIYKFTTRFQPQGENLTFADAIIEVLFNICNSPSLIPNFTLIFKQLSLQVKLLSLFCSYKSIELFSICSQNLTKEDSNKIFLTENFLESFANIIQRPDSNEYFRIVMAQQAGSFMFLKQVNSLESPAINIISKYLAAIRERILKITPSKVDIGEMDNVVRTLDTKSIFENVLLFEVPKLKLSAKLESSWAEWAEVLFLQCFRTELEIIKQNDIILSAR